MYLKHKFVIESKSSGKKLIIDTFEKFCDLKPRPKSLARIYLNHPNEVYCTHDYTLEPHKETRKL